MQCQNVSSGVAFCNVDKCQQNLYGGLKIYLWIKIKLLPWVDVHLLKLDSLCHYQNSSPSFLKSLIKKEKGESALLESLQCILGPVVEDLCMQFLWVLLTRADKNGMDDFRLSTLEDIVTFHSILQIHSQFWQTHITYFVCNMCVCASPCWPRSVSVSPDPYNSPLKNFRALTRKQRKPKSACAQYISSGIVITILNSMPITIIYSKFLPISYLILLVCIQYEIIFHEYTVISIKWIKYSRCSIQFILLSMAVSPIDQLYR